MPRAASSSRARRGRRSDEDVLRLIPDYDPIVTAGRCRFDPAAARKAVVVFKDCLTFTAINLKPSKKKSTDRIDGLVAAIMALGQALLHGAETGPYIILPTWLG